MAARSASAARTKKAWKLLRKNARHKYGAGALIVKAAGFQAVFIQANKIK
jgi:hypothetical protein